MAGFEIIDPHNAHPVTKYLDYHSERVDDKGSFIHFFFCCCFCNGSMVGMRPMNDLTETLLDLTHDASWDWIDRFLM